VQDSLSWAPIVLFVAMFLWTPPHFWALAVKYADDYRAADVPMLPVGGADRGRRPPDDLVHGRAGHHHAGPVPVADLGWIYGITAAVLGAMFLGGTIALKRHPTAGASMRLFGFSITYVTVLFGAMTVDVLVRNGW
jgi:protoheme IX farnesyltransferase